MELFLKRSKCCEAIIGTIPETFSLLEQIKSLYTLLLVECQAARLHIGCSKVQLEGEPLNVIKALKVDLSSSP